MEGACDGRGVARGTLRSERTFLADLRERLAFDKFHREEMLAAVFPNIMDGDDVSMLERGGSLGFGAETRDERITGEFAEEERFDRNDAVERNLPRAKNDAHPAARHFFKQFVITDRGVRFGFVFFGKSIARLGPK